jgi:hypothetical protein
MQHLQLAASQHAAAALVLFSSSRSHCNDDSKDEHEKGLDGGHCVFFGVVWMLFLWFEDFVSPMNVIVLQMQRASPGEPTQARGTFHAYRARVRFVNSRPGLSCPRLTSPGTLVEWGRKPARDALIGLMIQLGTGAS